ncbi:zinc ribbon domain-containing protein [Chloroflexota bacterium]
MPIYDFRCRECGNVSEVFLRSMDASPARCAICGSDGLEKLVSASYMIRSESGTRGTTCCGRAEQCEAPPCSTGSACRRK